MNKLFFYCPIVSKSLLIVIGTLLVVSLPARNDREQHRTAGINRSRDAWSTQRTRVAHASRRPCTAMFDLPAVLTYLRTCARRGTCGIKPHLPLALLQHLAFVNGVAQVTTCSLATAPPIVPFGGLPLSRLST